MVWLPYDAGLSAAAETPMGMLKRVIVSLTVYPRFLEVAELARSLCHSWATCMCLMHAIWTLAPHADFITTTFKAIVNQKAIPFCHLRLVCDLCNRMSHTSNVEGCGNITHGVQSINNNFNFVCCCRNIDNCQSGITREHRHKISWIDTFCSIGKRNMPRIIIRPIHNAPDVIWTKQAHEVKRAIFACRHQ